MRDRSVRRVTKRQPRTRTPEHVEVQHWRQHHRVNVLRDLADGAHGLGWTRRLVTTLLDDSTSLTNSIDSSAPSPACPPASSHG